MASRLAVSEQQIKQLEYQVNNDVTDRRVIAEMREDLSAIKAQVTDIKGELGSMYCKLDHT